LHEGSLRRKLSNPPTPPKPTVSLRGQGEPRLLGRRTIDDRASSLRVATDGRAGGQRVSI